MSHAHKADKLLIKPAAGARPAPPRTRGRIISRARKAATRPTSHKQRADPGWRGRQTDRPDESHRCPTLACPCGSSVPAQHRIALRPSRREGAEMPEELVRDHLPIPDRPYAGPVYEDAKDPEAKFPPIEPLRPPAGAPNVLIILLDDVGFGASSAFGGPCATPTAERLAANGLKYNRFHTTALCSPTRQALLTGRNHHSVGMGGITEIATSAPGYNSIRPNTAAPLAETLKLNGYSTAQFGKCHEVPVWETSPLGPFDSWPTGGGGFEHFYGFIGGETNQYAPAIYDGTTPDRAGPDAGGGLPLHGGHDRPGDRLDPRAEGAHARQAVLRLLRAGRDACAAPRAAGVVGQVQGPVRRRLGRASRADARPPEGARRRARGRGAHRARAPRSPPGTTCRTS